MKADEFKKILKPLIRQTIKEVILDEGVLSGVISEVVKGMQIPLVEARNPQATVEQPQREAGIKRKEEEYEKQILGIREAEYAPLSKQND